MKVLTDQEFVNTRKGPVVIKSQTCPRCEVFLKMPELANAIVYIFSPRSSDEVRARLQAAGILSVPAVLDCGTETAMSGEPDELLRFIELISK